MHHRAIYNLLSGKRDARGDVRFTKRTNSLTGAMSAAAKVSRSGFSSD